MCQKCIDELRIAMTANNEQENLEKLAVVEEASNFQKKITGNELNRFEIMFAVALLPLEMLKEATAEHKEKLSVIRQMQQN